MKCRSIPVSALLSGDRSKCKGTRIFTEFVLQFPDFIEFDDLNGKIITRHSIERAFRVWDITTYKLCYVLKHEHLIEFKICNGIILLMFESVRGAIPMTVINAHTGSPIMNIGY